MLASKCIPTKFWINTGVSQCVASESHRTRPLCSLKNPSHTLLSPTHSRYFNPSFRYFLLSLSFSVFSSAWFWILRNWAFRVSIFLCMCAYSSLSVSTFTVIFWCLVSFFFPPFFCLLLKSMWFSVSWFNCISVA